MDTETTVYRNYSGYLSFRIPQPTPSAGNEEIANMVTGGLYRCPNSSACAIQNTLAPLTQCCSPVAVLPIVEPSRYVSASEWCTHCLVIGLQC